MNRTRLGAYLVALLVAVLTVSGGDVRGTTIVVTQNGTHVLLAADSLELIDDESKQVCKIHSAGNAFYAIAGTAAYREFDAVGLAEKAIAQSGSVEGAVTVFRKVVPKRFADALARMSTERHGEYADVRRKKQPLQGVFAAIENGAPKYVIVFFTVADSPYGGLAVSAHFRSCPGSACPLHRTDINVLGENDAATRAMDSPDIRSDPNLTSVAQKLILAEIMDKPDKVGPPVSEVLIDRSGAHWQSRGDCN